MWWLRRRNVDRFNLFKLHSLAENLVATYSVALIAPTHSYRASVYLRAAQQHDISIVLISDGSLSVVPAFINGIRVEFADLANSKQTICRLLDTYGVQAVIAPDEKYVALAAEISHQIGLPHNDVDALKTSADKFLMRKTLHLAGMQTVPDFQLIDMQMALNEQLVQIKYPCVAKPLNMTASRGVIRANTQAELEDALQVIQQIVQREFENTDSIKVLVEDYIGGTEHALEGYLSDSKLEVICLFDKPDPLHGPYFEETYYVTPSRLDQSTQEEIRKTIQVGCIALGLTLGPIHAEVRLHRGLVWILEIAGRSIGGDCARLFELATCSSIEEYVLCRIVGKSVDDLSLNRAAGVLMIPVTDDGILRRIEGVTDAQLIENILEVRLDVRAGERLNRWPQGGKYPGYIYALADSPEKVESSLRASYSQLKFICMPDLPVLVK